MTMNGHQHDPMALGVLLGGLQAESHRQTEIMLAALNETRELRLEMAALPGSIADHIRDARPATSRLRHVKEIIQASVPLVLLAMLVAGKIALADALPLIRMALGGI